MHIALSSWTYHDALYKGTLGLAGIPVRARDLGFDAVELQDMFLWPRGNRLLRVLSRILRPFFPAPPPRDYLPLGLGRLRAALAASGVRLAAWDVDTDFYNLPPERTLAYGRLGLRAARRLGAGTVRITAGPHASTGSRRERGSRGGVGAEAAVVRRLADDAGRLGLTLALENHLDALGDPAQLAAFVREVNHPRLGVCLDFGNFERGREADGVRLLAPLAVYAHAKCWAFDERGEETHLNYRETMAALRHAGFAGTIAIEYEGGGDPDENALRARALIEQCW